MLLFMCTVGPTILTTITNRPIKNTSTPLTIARVSVQEDLDLESLFNLTFLL